MNTSASSEPVRCVLEMLRFMVGVAEVMVREAFSPRVASLLRDSECRLELLQSLIEPAEFPAGDTEVDQDPCFPVLATGLSGCPEGTVNLTV